MQIDRLWSVVMETAHHHHHLEAYIAHGVVGIFAAVLVLLSLYSWSRRRQVGLLLVSLAFLVFCSKEIFWILSEMYGFNFSETGRFVTDLITVLTDFIMLGFFFLAIVIRPRKKLD